MRKIERIALIGLGAMGVFFAPRLYETFGENTLILSLLNGVDSEEKLIKKFGEEHVLYAFMRMSIVMKDGKADFDPYWGKIHFGEKKNETISDRVLAVKEVFDKADIPYEIEEDMLKGIWFKYMCNIGENMTCALLGIPFGFFRKSDSANWIRVNAMREVAAIAQKKGIDIGEKEIARQEKTVMTIPPENKPSTLQDLEAEKLTEVEMFAGTVVKMGKELGVPTPINEMFYHGIRVHEEKFAK